MIWTREPGNDAGDASDRPIQMTSATAPILVVEDDPATRSLMSEMLVLLGHQVSAAASAEEALAMVEQGRHRFAILLADINLPGMSGIRLADILVRKLPGLRVVFVSGNGFLVADKTDFDFRLLPKPFDLYQLQLVLNETELFAGLPVAAARPSLQK
ncbi:hypothetical protein NCCP691_33210 [Noviherbaspirillum aridicola]|uniref:Response regulatory domain-containing protein n=2 Tax=Noviherbaspirillum aridicola TaxID=2849687 RepID=A0ABQ4Q7W2_9BURK|nr:hypothetical protein NCCP691_33210 [Noviherbaspirillum aridicola]